MNFFCPFIITGCLGSVFAICSMELPDQALLDLAKNDPHCFSSAATIPLLQEHEQKELLAHMAGAAAPGQKRKTTMDQAVSEKLEQLHRGTLLRMEPAPDLIHSCKGKQLANSLSHKIHATADGALLVNSYEGAFDISGQEYMPLHSNQRSRVQGWILGGSETVLYHLSVSGGLDFLQHDTITAWDLPTRAQLYTKRLSECFWDQHSGKNSQWRDGIKPTQEEKSAAIVVLSQMNQEFGYLALLPTDLRTHLLGAYVSWIRPFFDTFAVDQKDKLFAVYNIDGLTKIGNARTGDIIRSLSGSAPYTNKKTGIFSDDNKWFLCKLNQPWTTEKVQPYLLVWNLEDEKRSSVRIEGDTAAFSPDSSQLATADHDTKKLQIWDLQTLSILATLQSHYCPAALRFNTDKTRLHIKSEGSSYKATVCAQEIWEVNSQACVYQHPQDRLRVVAEEHDMVASTGKGWGSKKQTKVKNLQTGQKLLLGAEAAKQFTFDPAGNYLLVTRSVTPPELYHAKTGCLIKVLEGKEYYHSSGKAKLNSFLPNNRLITSNDGEATLWQLHPIDWSKVSAREKMAFCILEHNYRTGRPFSNAAAACVTTLQEIAQKRYPMHLTLADIVPSLIPFELGPANLNHDERAGIIMQRLHIHQKGCNGGMASGFKTLNGPKTGQLDFTIRPTSTDRYDHIKLPQDQAHIVYYLLHRFFNEQPKKD